MAKKKSTPTSTVDRMFSSNKSTSSITKSKKQTTPDDSIDIISELKSTKSKSEPIIQNDNTPAKTSEVQTFDSMVEENCANVLSMLNTNNASNDKVSTLSSVQHFGGTNDVTLNNYKWLLTDDTNEVIMSEDDVGIVIGRSWLPHDNFTITSFDSMIGFDRVDGSLYFVMDELTDLTLSQEEERVEITGRSGRTISILKKNKRVTCSGTNGFLSGGALAAMVGDEIQCETDDYAIRYTDTITVNNNQGVTTETAIGTVGNEIGILYVRDESNAYITGGVKLTQTSGTPSEGEFSYDPDTKIITFNANDVTNGMEVYAFYNAIVTGANIHNDANNFSKVLAVYLNCTIQNSCDQQFHGQFIFERADFNGTFDITGGSDPSTQSFEFTSLPNGCTGKTTLWDFILFN